MTNVPDQDNEPSPSMHPSSRPPGETETEESRAPRVRLERVVRDALRRALEKGVEAGIGSMSVRTIRSVLEDAKLPREIANFFFSQMEETKSGMLRVASREIRHFLRDADIASELRRVLTSMSFEVRTEIRFIPNEAGDGLKPQVKTAATPKNASKERTEENT